MSKKPKHNTKQQEASSSASSARDASIVSVREARKTELSAHELVQQLKSGDKTALSRAITLIESAASKHQEQSREIVKLAFGPSNSLRIGITGVPGVGKSTFIEQLGIMLTEKGHRVAVLAVDPSSSLSGGSILGDKTRMQQLTQSPLAFIRPTPSRLTLGGVARHTRESIILCEAAGYDLILIETVGVGQSETAVAQLCDFFLLLQLAGAGDELQGIKRGIIEMADAIVINKADNDAQLKTARAAQLEYQRALGLFPHKSSGWQPRTLTCSALHNIGIDAIWAMIQDYVALTKSNGYFTQKRKNQNLNWLENTVIDALRAQLLLHPEVMVQWNALKEEVTSEKITPIAAAEILVDLALKTNAGPKPGS
jgi:LAO/AO transport system kinase